MSAQSSTKEKSGRMSENVFWDGINTIIFQFSLLSSHMFTTCIDMTWKWAFHYEDMAEHQNGWVGIIDMVSHIA